MQHPPKRTRELLSKYVCVSIKELGGIDIGLYDFDGTNTIYFFAVNSDEHIYLRYGGGENSPQNRHRPLDEYLSMASFQLALELGLQQHDLYLQGQLASTARPPAKFPRDIRSIKADYLNENTGRVACFHCHFARHYEWGDRDALGMFDKLSEVWVFPELTRIGIHVDVDTGVGIDWVTGFAKRAGMRAGDKIVAINDRHVLTYGDLHHAYHKLPHDATDVTFCVKRGSDCKDIHVPLPADWRVTNVSNRVWRLRVDPGFDAHGLTPREQMRLGLKVGGLSARVRRVHDNRPDGPQSAGLRDGDVVFAVDGSDVDTEYGQDLYTYIKLRKEVGDTILLGVLRGNQPLQVRYQLGIESHAKWAQSNGPSATE